jgi:hypothetical protein
MPCLAKGVMICRVAAPSEGNYQVYRLSQGQSLTARMWAVDLFGWVALYGVAVPDIIMGQRMWRGLY